MEWLRSGGQLDVRQGRLLCGGLLYSGQGGRTSQEHHHPLCSLPPAQSRGKLRYFVPVLEEVFAESFPPDYWSHLQFNLGRCEEYWRRHPASAPGRA